MWLPCCLVLLSNDSNGFAIIAKPGNKAVAPPGPDPFKPTMTHFNVDSMRFQIEKNIISKQCVILSRRHNQMRHVSWQCVTGYMGFWFFCIFQESCTQFELLYYISCSLVTVNLTIFFRITSLAPGQSDCPNASEVVLKNMCKVIKTNIKTDDTEQKSKTNQSRTLRILFGSYFMDQNVWGKVILIYICHHFNTATTNIHLHADKEIT